MAHLLPISFKACRLQQRPKAEIAIETSSIAKISASIRELRGRIYRPMDYMKELDGLCRRWPSRCYTRVIKRRRRHSWRKSASWSLHLEIAMWSNFMASPSGRMAYGSSLSTWRYFSSILTKWTHTFLLSRCRQLSIGHRLAFLLSCTPGKLVKESDLGGCLISSESWLFQVDLTTSTSKVYSHRAEIWEEPWPWRTLKGSPGGIKASKWPAM